MLVNHPEKLVPGKYNIIAVGGNDAAILWKDGEYFAVGAMDPWTEPISIGEELAHGFIAKGSMLVSSNPIALDDLSEWKQRAAELAVQAAA